jgi:hypothetical protein
MFCVFCVPISFSCTEHQKQAGRPPVHVQTNKTVRVRFGPKTNSEYETSDAVRPSTHTPYESNPAKTLEFLLKTSRNSYASTLCAIVDFLTSRSHTSERKCTIELYLAVQSLPRWLLGGVFELGYVSVHAYKVEKGCFNTLLGPNH